jgi:hypothetical protein
MEFRTFPDGEKRLPTWAEKETMEDLREAGVEDVYRVPDEAPQEFWEVLVQSVDWSVQSVEANSAVWEAWAREIRWAQGLGDFVVIPRVTFKEMVGQGNFRIKGGRIPVKASAALRLAAVELLLNVTVPDPAFQEQVNDRARWFRVGIRLEGTRFVPLTSEFLHEHVVRPALLLLADERFSAVDSLYRKGFDRALSNDPAGAITASNSAVEEMLRLGTGVKGGSLDKLAMQARQDGWISPAVHQLVVKLAALRDESDAHTLGTDETEVAMFTLNLSGSILVHLERTLPSALEGRVDP